MKYSLLFPATMGLLALSSLHAGAALENRADSLGPLKPYNPNEPVPGFIVKIHGDPRKGLPETAGHRVQRVSENSWYVEMGKRIARMEPDYPSGQVVIRDVVDAAGEWVISQDGKLIFATRQVEGRGTEVSECFDLETGESKWTFEKGMSVMDACFTPDGKQVVILHSLPHPKPGAPPTIPPNPTEEDLSKLMKSASPEQAAVSWYDAATGEMTRRVNMPGEGFARGLGADYLAFSRNFLYVARPGDDTPVQCMFIKDGATEPVELDAEPPGREEEAAVRVGGKFGELVVFYTERAAVLFRRDKEGALTKIAEVELDSDSHGNSYRWGARFAPDGNHLVLSSCVRTILVPTRESGEDQRKMLAGSSHLADYSGDGKFFVTFDDGGGRVRTAATWEKIDNFQNKLRPPHCCPITEAGFSFFGDYIISCDNVRMLLWTKEGVQIAELYSPRSNNDQAVRMQSPVILEKEGKIYGADGYDFLVWDLKSLMQRLSRRPDNVPRVKGTAVFADRARNNTEPEIMNIRIDPKGENIITATRSAVRYRPLATSEPVVVPVPKNDIFMRPRMFMDGISPSTVIIRPGSDAYSLDLAGKSDSVSLAQSAIGFYTADNQTFVITSGGGSEATILSRPVGPVGTPGDPPVKSTRLVTFPVGWYLRTEFAVSSPDGKWLFAIPTVWGKGSVIAAVDLTKKEIVRSMPVSWTATTLSLSKDGKRLLVGSTNRAVYEFDVQKMTAQP